MSCLYVRPVRPPSAGSRHSHSVHGSSCPALVPPYASVSGGSVTRMCWLCSFRSSTVKCYLQGPDPFGHAVVSRLRLCPIAKNDGSKLKNHHYLVQFGVSDSSVAMEIVPLPNAAGRVCGYCGLLWTCVIADNAIHTVCTVHQASASRTSSKGPTDGTRPTSSTASADYVGLFRIAAAYPISSTVTACAVWQGPP